MWFLLVFAMLAFIPIKTEVEGNVCNLKIKAKIRTTFLYFLPVTIWLFNMEDIPWRFKAKLFGKVKKIKRSTAKKSNMKIYNHIKNNTGYKIKFILSLLKYVKWLKLTGGIGISQRADATAIINGYINGIFCPAVMISRIKRAYICFIPQYNEDIFRVNFKCIISFSPANIIHEGILYYLQRRKLNGKHN